MDRELISVTDVKLSIFNCLFNWCFHTEILKLICPPGNQTTKSLMFTDFQLLKS